MSKRVTIMIEDDLMKKLREKQAKQIRESEKSVSLSSLINDVLRKSIK